VGVVGVAVVGRAHGNDRPERGRPTRGDLQRVESAPGDAHEADRAGAPGLPGDPGDDIERVVVLLLRVLVAQNAVGVAGAAEIDAHRGISMAGEIPVHGLVAPAREVALAIGNVLQDRGDAVRVRVRGQPDARGEAGPVRHGDPDVLDAANATWKGVDGSHGLDAWTVLCRAVVPARRTRGGPEARRGSTRRAAPERRVLP